ncbi:MAG: hypothetical protein FJ088_01330 [Deltaproteobacteria bacterium]|nr:hypothetical protein [Deltaproteobacteria bacterium]
MDEKVKAQVVTKVITSKDLRKAAKVENLTDEEERVLRMRYGVTESRSAVLERKGQNNKEIRAKLALIEREILDELNRRNPAPKSPKEKIIERMKKM